MDKATIASEDKKSDKLLINIDPTLKRRAQEYCTQERRSLRSLVEYTLEEFLSRNQRAFVSADGSMLPIGQKQEAGPVNETA